MESINTLLSRRSIRKYTKDPVPEEVKQNILEAGRLAPSATNVQPWHFIVITNQEGKQACSFGNFNRWTSEADFIVVGVYRTSNPMMDNFAKMDVTIALQNMVIAGWLQGVGSCWIGAWNDAHLRQVLDVPDDCVIVGIIPFGYPDGIPVTPSKKPLDQIIHKEKW
ncbi:nitroreductase family protein [archaeon]|nr:nitroreductase family protein [archaeon]